MFRISRDGQEPFVEVESVAQIVPAIRSRPPGQYAIDEVSDDPLVGRHASRRWGTGIICPDGVISIKPNQWEVGE